jgi:hypothetical protein
LNVNEFNVNVNAKLNASELNANDSVNWNINASSVHVNLSWNANARNKNAFAMNNDLNASVCFTVRNLNVSVCS